MRVVSDIAGKMYAKVQTKIEMPSNLYRYLSQVILSLKWRK